MKFVHTFDLEFSIIITVKPPNTLYSFLLPHSKKYLLFRKEQPDEWLFFSLYGNISAAGGGKSAADSV